MIHPGFEAIKATLQEEISSEGSIANAPIGSRLSDGSILVCRHGGKALTIAPPDTKVKVTDPNCEKVTSAIINRKLTPEEWHVPTLEELRLAKITNDHIRGKTGNYLVFSPNDKGFFSSDTDENGLNICFHFMSGNEHSNSGANLARVLMFRWVSMEGCSLTA